MNVTNVMKRTLKYLIEGLAVAVAAYLIPRKALRMEEIFIIAITSASVLALLDVVSPSIASSTRVGMGFGLGAGQVGFPNR